MKKREACELVGVDSIKDLANLLDINYDSLRSIKELSTMHIKLVRWEIDKQFIESIKDIGNHSFDANIQHLAKHKRIDDLLSREVASEIARANDN